MQILIFTIKVSAIAFSLAEAIVRALTVVDGPTSQYFTPDWLAMC